MHDITIEPFRREKHLSLVEKWWALYYDGDVFPDYCVPENGVVAVNEGRVIGSIFLYINDSDLAHMAFPIIDPDVSIREKIEVMSCLVEGGTEEAKKKLGEKAVIFAITHNRSVGSALKKSGFEDNDTMKTFAYAVGDADIEFLE